MIYYLRDPRPFATEIHRVLKRGVLAACDESEYLFIEEYRTDRVPRRRAAQRSLRNGRTLGWQNIVIK